MSEGQGRSSEGGKKFKKREEERRKEGKKKKEKREKRKKKRGREEKRKKRKEERGRGGKVGRWFFHLGNFLGAIPAGRKKRKLLTADHSFLAQVV